MPESITLSGLASRVPLARHTVGRILQDCPRRDDAELIVSEYAGNAVRHSRSRDGGVFQVVVDLKPGWLRLEVIDGGALPADRAAWGADDEFGRGLLVVRAVADRWGQQRSDDEVVWWAELDWDE